LRNSLLLGRLMLFRDHLWLGIDSRLLILTFEGAAIAIGDKLQLVEIYAALRLSGRFSAAWKVRNKRGSFRGHINDSIALKIRNGSKNDDNMIIRGLGQKECGVGSRKFLAPRTFKSFE